MTLTIIRFSHDIDDDDGDVVDYDVDVEHDAPLIVLAKMAKKKHAARVV